jgi:hypothetical protein
MLRDTENAKEKKQSDEVVVAIVVAMMWGCTSDRYGVGGGLRSSWFTNC